MYPIVEYLKNNDPTLNKSLYDIIPIKFSQTLTLFANKHVDVSNLEELFADINETMIIGLEKSPHNAIKILSALLISIPHTNTYYNRIQDVGCGIIQSLYKIIKEGIQSMNKDTIDKLEKDVEVFSYIAHNLLTLDLTSPIFELSEVEKSEGKVQPFEFVILIQILEIIKLLGSKLKQEFLQTLEIIEEKMWLCLILRMNYLCKRNSEEAIKFMDSTMLDFIFEDIKKYDISDDRYLRFVIQYISPADCLSLLVSENIEKKPDLRKFKKKILSQRDEKLDEIFVPYERYMRESERVQNK
jgi:hypothetical protein